MQPRVLRLPSNIDAVGLESLAGACGRVHDDAIDERVEHNAFAVDVEFVPYDAHITSMEWCECAGAVRGVEDLSGAVGAFFEGFAGGEPFASRNVTGSEVGSESFEVAFDPREIEIDLRRLGLAGECTGHGWGFESVD